MFLVKKQVEGTFLGRESVPFLIILGTGSQSLFHHALHKSSKLLNHMSDLKNSNNYKIVFSTSIICIQCLRSLNVSGARNKRIK